MVEKAYTVTFKPNSEKDDPAVYQIYIARSSDDTHYAGMIVARNSDTPRPKGITMHWWVSGSNVEELAADIDNQTFELNQGKEPIYSKSRWL